ncbi:YxiG-like protein [Phaeacidiphilus oryzae]
MSTRNEYLGCLFGYCVEAECRSAVRPEIWARSLDDRLIDHATGAELDGT